MWRRRFVYSAIFFLGTTLAGAGWFEELWDLQVDLLYVAIAGHALQVIGAFGHLMTPETLEESEDS